MQECSVIAKVDQGCLSMVVVPKANMCGTDQIEQECVETGIFYLLLSRHLGSKSIFQA